MLVNNVSIVMYKNLGVPNGELGMYTSLLYLPWVIKPLWSPFVDVLRTKRWWVVAMQAVMTVCFAAVALALAGFGGAGAFAGAGAGADAGGGFGAGPLFVATLVIFYITAMASATHDIAADGFYMLALDSHRQAQFVGIRSTFYRIATVFGQGVLVMVAGALEQGMGRVPAAWSVTLLVSAIAFALMTAWHTRMLPAPPADISRCGADEDAANGSADSPRRADEDAANGSADSPRRADDENSASGSAAPRASRHGGEDAAVADAVPTQGRDIARGLAQSFVTFFRRGGVWLAILFMLLFRLPEAFSVKMLSPFMLDSAARGGLGMSTASVGLVYGTVGVVALTLGGIIGGLAAGRWGLRKMMFPMALSLALPCAVYLVMALVQPSSIWFVGACVAFDQFGYGFGFTAYMLYMIWFSRGKYETSHYAICTAFMALSMMLPGMIAGYMQERMGYVGFFWMVMACCLATVAVAALAARRVEPDYGRKT